MDPCRRGPLTFDGSEKVLDLFFRFSSVVDDTFTSKTEPSRRTPVDPRFRSLRTTPSETALPGHSVGLGDVPTVGRLGGFLWSRESERTPTQKWFNQVMVRSGRVFPK